MQISVVGCGWLGFPLAKMFKQQNCIVKGSTTSTEKLNFLSAEGILPYKILLTAEGIVGHINAFLEDSEILVINIPPKIKITGPEDYLDKLKHLLLQIKNSSIEKVLFVSSTSVYPDAPEFPVYEETDLYLEKSPAANILLEAEKLFFQNEKFKTSIVRFGGLIGEERHPVKHLAGKKEIKNPKAPVNLIQLGDCVRVLSRIIEKEAWGSVFNAVFPHHPQKSDYYGNKAAALNLPLPIFDFENASEGKIISSNKLQEELEFKFLYKI